jgi:hypothetical protein
MLFIITVWFFKSRLKNEYLLKQRRLFMSGDQVISMAETGLLRELKLANDNLRWRLGQGRHVLQSKNQEISRLNSIIRQQQNRIVELESTSLSEMN